MRGGGGGGVSKKLFIIKLLRVRLFHFFFFFFFFFLFSPLFTCWENEKIITAPPISVSMFLVFSDRAAHCLKTTKA